MYQYRSEAKLTSIAIPITIVYEIGAVIVANIGQIIPTACFFS